jgi:hypothetical protein
MLGIDDPGIYIVYLLTIASAILCVWYGAVNWNKGAENEEAEISEEMKWEAKEKELDENL